MLRDAGFFVDDSHARNWNSFPLVHRGPIQPDQIAESRLAASFSDDLCKDFVSHDAPMYSGAIVMSSETILANNSHGNHLAAAMTGMGERLKQMREAMGWSQPFVAEKLHVTRGAVSNWETEKNEIDPKNLEALASLYEVSVDYILLGDQSVVDIHKGHPAPKSGSDANRSVRVSTVRGGPDTWKQKVPIRGFAKAGRDGRYVDNGEVIGMAPCPPWLENVQGSYAVFIQDDCMEPRYFHNEIVFANPHKPVRPGDHVIIQLDDGDAVIKRLERRTQKFVTCKQYNPPKLIEYEASRVVRIHRVVLGGEDPT